MARNSIGPSRRDNIVPARSVPATEISKNRYEREFRIGIKAREGRHQE
jgi:hypothetical protein